MSVDTLISGATLITVDPTRRIIRNGSIAVANGRIVAVGTDDEVGQPDAARGIDARGKVVTPGLVDAHVHLSHHLHRSILSDEFPEEREHDHWRPYWTLLTEEDALSSAKLACAEMLLNGTTLFCDMSGRYSGELQAEAARALGIRGIISEISWDLPPHPSVAIGTTAECVRRLESLVERFPFSPDATVWAAVGMSGMGRSTDELLQGASAVARSVGVPFYMHQSFAEADTANFRKRTGGRSAVEHLEALGVAGPDLALVHMIRTEEADVPVLARTGTSVVHCPGASVRWGLGSSQTGRVPELLDAGVNVALGSDSGNYADSLDIAHQLYLATTIHREARGGTPHVSAEQALGMATRNGARALGVEEYAGSLEVGKWADLVIHDAGRPEWRPGIDPITTFAYSARSRGVETVMVGGRIVVEGGRIDGLDAILTEASGRAIALEKRMTDDPRFSWPRT